MKFLSRTSTLLLCASFALVATAACDLPQKDIGNESDRGGDSSGMDSPCEPGDQMPAPDGCNTCSCGEDGNWACTVLYCDPSGSDSNGSDTAGEQCQDGDTKLADDGCNTCTCGNGYWACTLLGCPDTDGGTGGGTDGTSDPFSNNGTHICDGSVPFDPVAIDAAAIDGNNLNVTLSYSGGCEVHLFGSCWDGSFLESFPVQVQLRIAHDGMMDACEALPTEERTFDLSALAEAYMDGYQTDSGTIEINLEGYTGPLTYTF